MIRSTESILIEALQLPLQERAALTTRLLASLDEHVDEGVDAAWDAEIAQRLKDIDEGKVQMVPGEQVMAELRRITRGERIDGREAV